MGPHKRQGKPPWRRARPLQHALSPHASPAPPGRPAKSLLSRKCYALRGWMAGTSAVG